MICCLNDPKLKLEWSDNISEGLGVYYMTIPHFVSLERLHEVLRVESSVNTAVALRIENSQAIGKHEGSRAMLNVPCCLSAAQPVRQGELTMKRQGHLA